MFEPFFYASSDPNSVEELQLNISVNNSEKTAFLVLSQNGFFSTAIISVERTMFTSNSCIQNEAIHLGSVMFQSELLTRNIH